MDIDKVNGRMHAPGLVGHGTAGKDNTFSQVLDRTMDTVNAEEGPAEAASAMSEVLPSARCEVSPVCRQALQRASKVLDLMEAYAQALHNPERTLKSIEPIVDQMQHALKGLDVQSIPYPKQHDELARLVNQIAVTASVEAFKFQRGDYIG